LEKGLKYNLHFKQKHRIEILALEADAALHLIDLEKQNYFRHTVAKNLQNLINKCNQSDLTIQLQNKADNGHTSVIMDKKKYDTKIMHFVNDNEFIQILVDPTKTYYFTSKLYHRQKS
jgi:hypothetical protein